MNSLSSDLLLGEREAGFTGVWVGGAKICAIGIQVSKWITCHGLALNINCDVLPFYQHIVACGLKVGYEPEQSFRSHACHVMSCVCPCACPCHLCRVVVSSISLPSFLMSPCQLFVLN